MRPRQKERASSMSCSHYWEMIRRPAFNLAILISASQVHCDEDSFISLIISVFIRQEQEHSQTEWCSRSSALPGGPDAESWLTTMQTMPLPCWDNDFISKNCSYWNNCSRMKIESRLTGSARTWKIFHSLCLCCTNSADCTDGRSCTSNLSYSLMCCNQAATACRYHCSLIHKVYGKCLDSPNGWDTRIDCFIRNKLLAGGKIVKENDLWQCKVCWTRGELHQLVSTLDKIIKAQWNLAGCPSPTLRKLPLNSTQSTSDVQLMSAINATLRTKKRAAGSREHGKAEKCYHGQAGSPAHHFDISQHRNKGTAAPTELQVLLSVEEGTALKREKSVGKKQCKSLELLAAIVANGIMSERSLQGSDMGKGWEQTMAYQKRWGY